MEHKKPAPAVPERERIRKLERKVLVLAIFQAVQVSVFGFLIVGLFRDLNAIGQSIQTIVDGMEQVNLLLAQIDNLVRVICNS